MAQPQQNPLSALGIGQQQGSAMQPPGQTPLTMSPDQYQFQQGMSQLDGLTQLINSKHAELSGMIQQHQNLRNKLGL